MQQKNLVSMIFSANNPLSQALQQQQTRQEVLQQLQADPEALYQYNNLLPHEREALIDFCMGNRGLKITYDPFSNKSSILSSILSDSVPCSLQFSNNPSP